MPVIPRQHFVNKLRRLGYTFHDRTKRVEVYKKGVEYVSIPTHRKIAELTVRHTLRQCGCSEQEILNFLKCAEL
jgi:hypothetical protein